MAITGDESVFPNNVVEVLSLRFDNMDDEITVLRRPLRTTDPATSIGVWGTLWTPDPESSEIRGLGAGSPIPGPQEPTLGRYIVTIQAFIKDMEEERGLARHSVLSMWVRAILYRDNALRVALASLNAEVAGVQERMMRWGVTAQRYLNNELGDNEWLYLSTVELWLETEIV